MFSDMWDATIWSNVGWARVSKRRRVVCIVDELAASSLDGGKSVSAG
jgi:hypothetical protein